MSTLAILALALYGIASVTPGTAFVSKPKLDPKSPKLYMGLVREGCWIALCIWVIGS